MTADQVFIDYTLTPKQRLSNISKLETPKSSDGFYLDAHGEKISFMGNRGLKPAYCELPLTQKHVEEIYKCMISVEYFFFNYCQVMTSNGFNFGDNRQYQVDLLNFLAEENRCVLSMPRQSSKSVTSGIHILHKILFNKEAIWGIAANKHNMSKEVLTKIKQTYSRLPFWLQQGVVSWNAFSIELENGSKVMTASTSASSFRGFTLTGLMIDEVSFLSQNLWEEFHDSVFPTVSSISSSQIILASTPNGLNHWYYMWMDAVEGRSEFKPYKINWYDVPGRDEKWLEKQIQTFGKLYVNQNYLCEFLGSSLTLIEAVNLQRMRHLAPIEMNKFIEGTNVYHLPIEKHKYILSVDTAKDGSDEFSFHVTDITKFPFKQVMSAGIQVSYLKMPRILLDIGTFYNNAFIIIENVEGSGQSVADTLYTIYEYENLYKDYNKDYPGFRTSKGSRPKILSILKTFIENEKIVLYDSRTISQLNTFIKRNGKYQADVGNKDDMVMSLAIMFAPFLNISAYADYEKFMNALEEVGYDVQGEEDEVPLSIDQMITIGYFDDGYEPDKVGLQEGVYSYDLGYNDYSSYIPEPDDTFG